MFKQTKFAVPSEFFPVAFADCSSNLVACYHFISLMSLFQRHVARRNLPYQGLIKRKEGLLKIRTGTERIQFYLFSLIFLVSFLVLCSQLNSATL